MRAKTVDLDGRLGRQARTVARIRLENGLKCTHKRVDDATVIKHENEADTDNKTSHEAGHEIGNETVIQ